MNPAPDAPAHILVVRLSAMGDIVHTLPAVATLRQSFPRARITWAVKPRWAALLKDNPYIDRVLPVDFPSWNFRSERFDLAIDFQGLLKSALVAFASRPGRIVGFHWELLREKAAGLFYSERVRSGAAHIVDRNLDLAAAAGARNRVVEFPLPAFPAEGELPDSGFVLASPFAGWKAKQWPAAYYTRLAALLRIPLVINCSPAERQEAEQIRGCTINVSSTEGLIGITRRARAVVGVDSGPLHLAAALGKPGVALFGPTDPARNGPYGNSFTVLRAPGAATSYRRSGGIASSMRAIDPEQVYDALQAQLSKNSVLEAVR